MLRSPTEWRIYIDWHTKYTGLMLRISRVYYSSKSRYQEIDIVESPDLGKCLLIDGVIQSTTYDEYIYHEALVHPVMLTVKDPKNVLIIGGGEGATIREVLKHDVKNVTVIDIDEELVNACKEHLKEMHQGSFYDKRVELIFGDGLQFLNESKMTYDVIILDLTDPTEDTSQLLYTQEFYSLIRDRLSNNGAMVTQATSPNFSPHCYSIIHNTIEQVFKYARAYIAPVRSYGGLWGFVIASNYNDPLYINEDAKISGKLLFYDKSIHRALFALPLSLRERIEREDRIATNSNRIYMPSFES